jgi:hypothetical protein
MTPPLKQPSGKLDRDEDYISKDEVMAIVNGFKDVIDAEIISLREIFNLRFSAMEAKFDTAIFNQSEKVTLATTALDKQLQAMVLATTNLMARGATFVPKTENDDWKLGVEKRLNELHDFQTVINTKASTGAVVAAYVISSVGVLIGIIDFVRTFMIK